MSERNLYKLLAVLLLSGILIIMFFNNFTNQIPNSHLLLKIYAQNEIEVMISNQFLNLTNFAYVLENNLCLKYKQELLGIMIVTSSAAHLKNREIHRQAISQEKLASLGFQRIFLLAALPSTEHEVTQRDLEQEQELFGDLLQGNFQDAYHNLTYKNLMGIRWAAVNCTRAQFILKVDDDIVFDIFQIKKYLEGMALNQSEIAYSAEFLAGVIFRNPAPVRDSRNKWYVSEKEYAPAYYPQYLSGWCFMTNPSTALRLVRQAYKTRNSIFWIDDTWLTGFLREPLNISMQFLNPWVTYKGYQMDCCINDTIQFNYACPHYIGPNFGNPMRLVSYLRYAEQCYNGGCVPRPANFTLRPECV